VKKILFSCYQTLSKSRIISLSIFAANLKRWMLMKTR
jgi:hypothetical protein